jgi:6-phosphogluconolactonase
LDVKQGKLALLPARPAEVPPAAGPRHLSFHPGGRTVFVLNERGSSVSWFDWDPDVGALQSIETVSSLPAGFRGVSAAADIHVHPSGQFVYASNRGHDSIAIFHVDESNRKLDLIDLQPTGGRHPRNFAITPDARQVLVANLESDNIVAFAIDERTGQLQPTGSVTEVPSPSCITFFVA